MWILLEHSFGSSLQRGGSDTRGEACYLRKVFLGAQVMIGAVGRVLKVERCERVQLVSSAVRLSIASCHDCVFYLGVNRPPLLLGDNRFLQVSLPLHL